MIQPAQRAELRRLRDAVSGSTKDLQDQIGQASGSLKASTLTKAVDQHPVAAVCIAAIGGCAISRIVGFRGLRFIALIAARSVASKAIAAVTKTD